MKTASLVRGAGMSNPKLAGRPSRGHHKPCLPRRNEGVRYGAMSASAKQKTLLSLSRVGIARPSSPTQGLLRLSPYRLCRGQRYLPRRFGAGAFYSVVSGPKPGSYAAHNVTEAHNALQSFGSVLRLHVKQHGAARGYEVENPGHKSQPAYARRT